MTHNRKIPPLPRSDEPAVSNTGKWRTTWYRTLSELWLTLEGIRSIIPVHETIYASAPPTSGAWEAGDITRRDPVQIGEPEYWLCVQSGTPGIWAPGPIVEPGIAGLSIWLDASDARTLNLDSSGGVIAWEDKRNSEQIWQQENSSNRPIRQIAAQNGLNTLRFTGSSSAFLTRLTASAAIGIESYTCISVKRRGGPAGANEVVLVGATDASICWWKTDGTVRIFGNGEYFDTSAASETNYVQFTVDKSPGAAGAWLNGSAISVSGPTAVTVGIMFLDIGRGQDGTTLNYTNGEIAELLVYNRVLTTAERELVENYLQTKWGT